MQYMLSEILVWVLHNLDLVHSYNLAIFIARVLRIFVLQRRLLNLYSETNRKISTN